jgi:2-succinyl-6-hydroxy-2,4-cyclohexadiene-1-carboxylate synthase
MARVNDSALYFERRGSGPALMLLHGFTGSGRSLDGIAQPLAREFSIIAPDLPGHGRSVGGAEVGAYGFEASVARVLATLELAGHAQADWLGYSLGARLALACAVRQPGRVRSLVLVGGRAGIADPGEREVRRRADAALADRLETNGIEAFVDEWLAQPLFATQQRLGVEFMAEQRRVRLGNDAHELAASLRALGPGAQPPLFDELARVAVPVLLVVGALDRPFAEHARELARRLPTAEVCVIEDAGHAVHLEQPAAFLHAVREFWRRCAAARLQSPDSTPVEETAS